MLHLSMHPIEETNKDRGLLNQTYGAEEPMKFYQNGGPRTDIDSVRFPKYTGWTKSNGAVPWIHALIFVDSVEGTSDLITGQFLGDIMIEPEETHAELSYVFVPKSWNRGIGTAATKALLREALPRLARHNIPKIEATAHVDNLGSWKLLERNGFTKTREEHRYHPDLTVKDRRVYELRVPAAQQASTSKTQETKCCAAS